MSRIKFILNDETKINQYGFRVRNAGLKLDRFQANSVLLDYHKDGNQAVIGKWHNIQIEGSLLTAEAEFDMEDSDAAKVAGKVQRGFIKGASLGLDPLSMNNFVLAPDGHYDLVECEVLEASVVAIPNNANALVTLFAQKPEGVIQYADTEVKTILLMAQDISNFKIDSMKKIILSVAAASALGLDANVEHDTVVVDQKILTLKSQLDTANQTIEGFKEMEVDKKNKLAATTVDADIAAGKVDATKRADFIKLNLEFPDLYKSTVTDTPAKQNLNDQVNNPAGSVVVKSLDDFQKLGLSAQLNFKQTNPEEYKAFFK